MGVILAELMGLKRQGRPSPTHQRRVDRGWRAQDPGGGGWVFTTDQCHRSRSSVTPMVTQTGAESGVRILHRRLSQERQEEPESGSIGGSGVELDSSGKQCCLIKALKALCLAFSRLSCSVSLSICFIRCTASLSFCLERCLICSISSSIPRTGRQLSIDNHCRHRGSDEGDAPLLLEADAVAEGRDVVIGGEQGDQAKDDTADGLGETQAIEVEEPEALEWG